MPLDPNLIDEQQGQGQLDPVVAESFEDTEEYYDRRKKYLRGKYVWGMVSPLRGTRKTYSDRAIQEVKDPEEQQFIVQEVAKAAKAQEWAARRNYNESNFFQRFYQNLQKVGTAFADAGTGQVEAVEKGVRQIAGKNLTEDQINFAKTLEAAKASENPNIGEDAPLSLKAAAGAAGMAPDMAAGLLAGQAAGAAGAAGKLGSVLSKGSRARALGQGAYWAGRLQPEERESFVAEGLGSGAATAAGAGSAAAQAAIELIEYDPTGLTSGAAKPLKGMLRKGVSKAVRKGGKALRSPVTRRGVGAGLRSFKRIGTETGEEALQGAVQEGGLYLAGELSEDVERRKPTAILQEAWSQGKEAAPGLAVLGGAGGAVQTAQTVQQAKGRLQRFAKRTEETKAEREAVTVADEGRTPSRSQWKEWGLPEEAGRSKEQRREGVRKIANQIHATDQAAMILNRVVPSFEQWKAWGLPESEGASAEDRMVNLRRRVMEGMEQEKKDVEFRTEVEQQVETLSPVAAFESPAELAKGFHTASAEVEQSGWYQFVRGEREADRSFEQIHKGAQDRLDMYTRKIESLKERESRIAHEARRKQTGRAEEVRRGLGPGPGDWHELPEGVEAPTSDSVEIAETDAGRFWRMKVSSSRQQELEQQAAQEVREQPQPGQPQEAAPIKSTTEMMTPVEQEATIEPRVDTESAAKREGLLGDFITDEVGRVGISAEALGRKIGLVRHGLRRFLTSKGELPESVYDQKVRKDGAVSRLQKEIAQTVKEYDIALQKAYGTTNPGTEVAEQMDAALKFPGAAEMRALPKELRPIIMKMRNHIDSLSQRLIDIGAVEGKMAEVVAANMGIYVTRAFRAFSDPKWAEKVPEDVRNKAKALFRAEYPEKTEEQIHSLIEALLYEGKAAESPIALLKRAQLGSKDLSILKRRKEIPPEILALLGEYKDPRVNYARSVTKIGSIVANHKFLENVRVLGLGAGFLSEEPAAGPFGEMKTRLAAKNSSAMSPLDGLYTTPEIKDAFIRATEREAVPALLRMMYALNGVVKVSKTAFSVMTQVRNVLANPAFSIINGHWRIGKAGGAVKAVMTDITNRGSAEWKDYILRATELGLLRQNVHAGELRDYIKEASSVDLDEFSYDTKKKQGMHRAAQGLKKIPKTAQDLYQAGDAVFKLYGWENEKARYREAFPEMDEKSLERYTAEIIRNTHPTYDKIPEGVQHLRRFLLTGTFVSFSAEIIRTTYHTAKLARKELSDPRTRSIGAGRMARLIAILGTPAAIAATSRLLNGVTRDEDEDLREFLPPWMKNSPIFHLGKAGDGVYNHVDIGYTAPHETLIKPVIAILRGEDATDGMWEGMKEFAEPYASEEILFGKFVDVWKNRTDSGRQVRNPQDSMDKQAKDVASHIWEAFEPGTLTSVERIYKGLSGTVEPTGRSYDTEAEILAILTGQRVQETDVAQSLKWRARDFRDQLRDADRILTTLLYSRGTVNPEELQAAYKSSDDSRKALFAQFSEAVKAAERLGVAPKQIGSTLVENGVPKRDFPYITGGGYPGIRMSKRRLESIRDAAPTQAEYVSRMEALAAAIQAANEDEGS